MQIVSVNNITATEGNSRTKSFVFTVSLNAPAVRNCSVNYITINGSAVAGSDYQSASGVVYFTAGQVSRTISVNVIGDIATEQDEQFTLQLLNPVGLTIGNKDGLGTIINDDVPGIRVGNISRTEGNIGTQIFTFPVTLDRTSNQPVTVGYTTVNGSALSGSDYVGTAGTVSFNPGETSKTISVVVYGDNIPESDETFQVVLNNPVNAIILTGTGTGTIKNDDRKKSPVLITSIYPNPTSDMINIKLENDFSSNLTLQLVDANGGKVKEWKINNSVKQNSYRLALGSVAQGLYSLRIIDDKGNSQVEKVVVER